MYQTFTEASIINNYWAFYAEESFTRINAFKAQECRDVRECLTSSYTIADILDVIAHHEKIGHSAHRLAVAREVLAQLQAKAILEAHSNLFTPTNTHDLREGDIIRSHGMVLRIGAKQISDQGCHADNGYGCAHYHLSEILAAQEDMPQPGTRLWNVQGNRLAVWSKYNA